MHCFGYRFFGLLCSPCGGDSGNSEVARGEKTKSFKKLLSSSVNSYGSCEGDGAKASFGLIITEVMLAVEDMMSTKVQGTCAGLQMNVFYSRCLAFADEIWKSLKF